VMLKVTRGRWPRNVSIPRAAGEDIFTSRLAREMKIFPYGRNVGAVVSAVMETDRQDASRKRERMPGWRTRGARRRWRGLVRSLPPRAPARLRLPRPRVSEGLPRHRALLRQWWRAPKSAWSSPWTTTLWVGLPCSMPIRGWLLLVSFFCEFCVSDRPWFRDRVRATGCCSGGCVSQPSSHGDRSEG
jgi:hypothetical protein